MKQSENRQDVRAIVFLGLNRGSNAQMDDPVSKFQDWWGWRETRGGCNVQERLQREDVELDLFLTLLNGAGDTRFMWAFQALEDQEEFPRPW